MKKIGFIGCGNISGIYFENITNLFKEIEIIGVTDIVRDRAENAAEKYGIKKVYKDMTELLADSEVDIVFNLTRPYEHFNVTMAALEAGKHVYTEKPLGASLDEAIKMRDLAKKKNLQIGGAPDTFLGAGLQTCRKLIDDGFIGDVFGASAYMVCRGHESWHPDPEFYYKYGGGPMMDMGPYYLTALISLLGSVKTVTGMTKASLSERTITSQPFHGKKIQVDVPTYITGTMNFQNNAIGTIFTTFDVYTAQVPRIEIYGSAGTLCVPDPNYFDGPVRLSRGGMQDFAEVPLLFDYKENSRGLGLADMAKALETGRSVRAGGDLLFHIVEIMTGFERASNERKFIDMESTVERPKPMVSPDIKGILD
jgi:predicted dehydrogenase